MKQILAIIPARGGSKGIPNKNIRNFCGKPLIGYSIEQAKDSQQINRVIVSTDSQQIADIAIEHGAEIPFLRPQKLATDTSQIVDAVTHLLTFLKEEESYIPEIIVLLQPTSPLRTAKDIDETISLLLSADADAGVTVSQTENLLFTKDSKDYIKVVPGTEVFTSSANRQELPDTYLLNGSMVYAIRTDVFLKEKTFLPKKVVGHVIERWRYVDLDEPQDFILGELIYGKKEDIQDKLDHFK